MHTILFNMMEMFAEAVGQFSSCFAYVDHSEQVMQ